MYLVFKNIYDNQAVVHYLTPCGEAMRVCSVAFNPLEKNENEQVFYIWHGTVTDRIISRVKISLLNYLDILPDLEDGKGVLTEFTEQGNIARQIELK